MEKLHEGLKVWNMILLKSLISSNESLIQSWRLIKMQFNLILGEKLF